jgi:hypothetical protein
MKVLIQVNEDPAESGLKNCEVDEDVAASE